MSVAETENHLTRITELEADLDRLEQKLSECQLTYHEVHKMLREERYNEARQLLETLAF